MTAEEILVATAVASWKTHVDRADKFFSNLSDEQLYRELAPGKNRLVYLWGHLIAVHDAMQPLLGVGPRQHVELDRPFVKEADRVVDGLPTRAQLKSSWDTVNGSLTVAFERFSVADWTAKHEAVSEADFAVNPLRNRLSVLLSRTAHVHYHLGQCMLAPK